MRPGRFSANGTERLSAVRSPCHRYTTDDAVTSNLGHQMGAGQATCSSAPARSRTTEPTDGQIFLWLGFRQKLRRIRTVSTDTLSAWSMPWSPSP
jgi:hypothetical protein